MVEGAGRIVGEPVFTQSGREIEDVPVGVHAAALQHIDVAGLRVDARKPGRLPSAGATVRYLWCQALTGSTSSGSRVILIDTRLRIDQLGKRKPDNWDCLEYALRCAQWAGWCIPSPLQHVPSPWRRPPHRRVLPEFPCHPVPCPRRRNEHDCGFPQRQWQSGKRAAARAMRAMRAMRR
jgi:hypothetical protein